MRQANEWTNGQKQQHINIKIQQYNQVQKYNKNI